jgi:hypothetical protein
MSSASRIAPLTDATISIRAQTTSERLNTRYLAVIVVVAWSEQPLISKDLPMAPQQLMALMFAQSLFGLLLSDQCRDAEWIKTTWSGDD